MTDRNDPPPAPEPSFRSLLASNLKVVGAAAALGVLAFAIWWGLRWLFPDVPWIQGRG